MTERTPEVQRMAALKDWLREDAWTVHAAACLLAGVLPSEGEREPDLELEPEVHSDQRLLERWLPGREVWDFGPEAWLYLVKKDIALMEKRVATIANLGFVSPAEVLALAIKGKKSSPPWLDAALNDAEARTLLPPEAREGHLPAKSVLTSQEVASKGGRAKREKDPQRAKFFPKVQKKLEEGKSVAEIITFLAATYSDAPPDKTVYGWKDQIMKERGE